MCPWQAALLQGEPPHPCQTRNIGESPANWQVAAATVSILCFKRLTELNGMPDPNLLKQDSLLLS